MEAFLSEVLPRWLPPPLTFKIHPHQGKADLLSKLPSRLAGYSKWLPDDWRIVVLVDRDDDDARELKTRLEGAASGLIATRSVNALQWKLVNRIVIEELEAWYFGDWSAVVAADPRVNANIGKKAKFREPDLISGGTWEAFERVLRSAGYHSTGLRKIEAARDVGRRFVPERCRSQSFGVLRVAINELLIE